MSLVYCSYADCYFCGNDRLCTKDRISLDDTGCCESYEFDADNDQSYNEMFYARCKDGDQNLYAEERYGKKIVIEGITYYAQCSLKFSNMLDFDCTLTEEVTGLAISWKNAHLHVAEIRKRCLNFNHL